jgi:Zn-dependent peptidase ImmA (M78 family)
MKEAATPTREQAEEFANAFASALLMPEKYVRARVSAGRDLQQLAYEFGVEQSHMKERLIGLGLFNQATNNIRPPARPLRYRY